MKDIILFGIQWCGKGTQAALLREAYPEMFSYFASGDCFRALRSTDNPIGNYLSQRMDAGMMIADEVTMRLVDMYVATVADDAKAMLIDGYPRNIAQLDHIAQIAQDHHRDIVGIYFTLDREIAKQRMVSRARPDDTPEGIETRLSRFFEKSLPMIDAFRQKFTLIEIDATPSIEEIAAKVREVVQN